MYNPLIIQHFSKGELVGEISDRDYELKIGNPVCGDTIFIYLKVNKKLDIIDAKYKAYGCATSIATASIFTEFVLEKINIREVCKTDKGYRQQMLGDLTPTQMHCYDILQELFIQLEQIQRSEV